MCTFFGLILPLFAQSEETSLPNILFINADDLTHSDLSVYGGQAHTPNFERLAAEGMQFSNCFQTAPMCSPTRHNLYTGIYPVKTGAYPNHTFAKEGTKSIVHHLKPLGYRVALSGKKHIAPESVFPFEYSSVKRNPDMEAIDQLMAESKEAGNPFCLFACSNEPHTPWNHGDPSQYPLDEIKLPPYFVDTKETRRGMAAYLAEITYYDGQVGQLLDLLDKHNLAENTIVMLSSEQGNSMPFAKWTLYDPGLQTALIARWPGKIAPGSKTEAMVEYVDVVPTLIDAIDGKLLGPVDGSSFLPVLLGESTEHKSHVYGIMTTNGINNGSDAFGIRSVRSKTHQLIINLNHEEKFTNACTQSPEFRSWIKRAGKGKERARNLVNHYHYRPEVELYDVTGDWHHWKNLATAPEHAETRKELKAKLDAWMEDQGDKGLPTELAAPEHQTRK
ncbi:MAG: sulfatase [Verrucomicrobiales bacterium]|nr:sulfatase [Verrucomicrobiales bacterium]